MSMFRTVSSRLLRQNKVNSHVETLHSVLFSDVNDVKRLKSESGVHTDRPQPNFAVLMFSRPPRQYSSYEALCTVSRLNVRQCSFSCSAQLFRSRRKSLDLHEFEFPLRVH